jgi:hypothetical protein
LAYYKEVAKQQSKREDCKNYQRQHSENKNSTSRIEAEEYFGTMVVCIHQNSLIVHLRFEHGFVNFASEK